MSKTKSNGEVKPSQNGNNSQDWKTADLRGWIRNDLKAAIALLDLIQSNEELFNLVCTAVESWRENMVKNEQKKEFVDLV